MTAFLHPQLLRQIVRDLLVTDLMPEPRLLVRFAYVSAAHSQAVVDVFAEEADVAVLDANMSITFPGLTTHAPYIFAGYDEKGKTKPGNVFVDVLRHIALRYAKVMEVGGGRHGLGIHFPLITQNHRLEAFVCHQPVRVKNVLNVEQIAALNGTLQQCSQLRNLEISDFEAKLGLVDFLNVEFLVLLVRDRYTCFWELCRLFTFQAREVFLTFETDELFASSFIDLFQFFGFEVCKDAKENLASVTTLTMNGNIAIDSSQLRFLWRLFVLCGRTFPNLEKLKLQIRTGSLSVHTYNTTLPADYWGVLVCNYWNEIREALRFTSTKFDVELRVQVETKQFSQLCRLEEVQEVLSVFECQETYYGYSFSKKEEAIEGKKLEMVVKVEGYMLIIDSSEHEVVEEEEE